MLSFTKIVLLDCSFKYFNKKSREMSINVATDRSEFPQKVFL